MNSLSIQNKRKQEQKEFLENNPHHKEKYINSDDLFNLGVIAVISFALIGLLVLTSIASKESEDDCKQVGGKYVVVDSTFAGKSVVDIYGCVK